VETKTSAADLRHHIEAIRGQYPAFRRQVEGQPAAFFDGPGGTQTPQCVIDAIGQYLGATNANHEGRFATSRESDVLLHDAHRAFAEFLGASDEDEIVFGANMTTLTFALSRSLAKTWAPGDEILLTRLDHDANFSPWLLAAQDAGAVVRIVEINEQDCTLDLDDLRSKLNSKTKLVAVGCASNAVGSINPVKQIAAWAREAGALVFVDAVHMAPHAQIDVSDIGCDFLACSVYKFFGPHVGVLWGKRDLLEELTAYKVRPAPASSPGKWMTGTQNHEGIAGSLAAVNYLADIGRRVSGAESFAGTLRDALSLAYRAIADYERGLLLELLEGLGDLPRYRLWGIADKNRVDERAPTIAITHDTINAADLAERLGGRGLFTWDGNYYALNLTESLGLEPHGMLRIGIVHYNTSDEVQRLLTALDEIS
jgi:cysteine desulfurase family protein (TIGR01976 family)